MVDQGRWEFVGGDYVEMDCNLPCGESLIRQRLVGQRFYLKHFGKIADIAWYDDVFGWPCTLPQILAKSGAKYFYTNKFCYSNESIKEVGDNFPFLHFLWRAPDSTSEVMLTWAKHKNGFWNQLKHFHEHSVQVKKGVNNIFNYTDSWEEMKSRTIQNKNDCIPLLINAYGHGDGGLGPRTGEIMEQMFWEFSDFVRNGTTKQMFALLEPYRSNLPVWQDELYLENHQGTLTSVGMIKENNATFEVMMRISESLAILESIFLKDELERANIMKLLNNDWKKGLFLQFHDVLPGSSIIEVYRDAAEDFSEIFYGAGTIQEKLLIDLSNNHNLLEKKDVNNQIMLYNPLAHSRDGLVVIPSNGFTSAVSYDGTPLAAQLIKHDFHVPNRNIAMGIELPTGYNYLKHTDGLNQMFKHEAEDNNLLLIYFPKTQALKQYSFTTITLHQSSTTFNSMIEFRESEIILKNTKIQIKIDRKTGAISELLSLSDLGKGKSQNYLSEPGIDLRMFVDAKTQFDAWNLDRNYKEKEVPISPVKEIIVLEDGPVRATIQIIYEKSKAASTFKHNISIIRDEPIIYGECLIDWQEEYKLLKLAIRTSFDSEDLISGVPYGIQRRRVVPQTVFEKARFEFASQQFNWLSASKTDIETEFNSLGLFSQSKYGTSCDNNRNLGASVYLSLLKAPHFEPYKEGVATLDDDNPRNDIVDQGFHRIPWCIKLFTSSDSLIDVIRFARDYNTPIISIKSNNKIKPISFVSIEPKNIELEWVKLQEEELKEASDFFYRPNPTETAVIARIVEYEGKESIGKITFNEKLPVKKVFEVDMLERVNNNGINNPTAKLEDRSIVFSISPYEIKSLLIIFSNYLE
jgi:alpha-mannosidase